MTTTKVISELIEENEMLLEALKITVPILEDIPYLCNVLNQVQQAITKAEAK